MSRSRDQESSDERTPVEASSPDSAARPPSWEPASRLELFSWCTFDFANSGYTTVIITTVFNAYFVRVVAGDRPEATFLWTLALAASYLIVLATAPVLGAIADYSAAKKRFLVWTTLACVLSTAALALVGPGDVLLAIVLIVVSNTGYAAGENLIAAFLPEIVPPERMGRLSGYGWAWGYVGGLVALGLCLLWLRWSSAHGVASDAAVPATNLIVAGLFGLAATPTFLWLKERRQRNLLPGAGDYVRAGFARLRRTLEEARRFRELFKLLLCITVYHCGINTVTVVMAIFAQQTLGFTTEENVQLVLLLNISAAVGAFVFGPIQDRIGSKRTIGLTLVLWSATVLAAYWIETRETFWIVANLGGIAIGSSQAAGRAMVGQFSPGEKAAEFFGLWGMGVKASAIVGPLSYGALNWATGSHRQAVLSTAVYFLGGLVLLALVDERRGKEAAAEYENDGEPRKAAAATPGSAGR